MKLIFFIILSIVLQLTLTYKLRHKRPLTNDEKHAKNFDFHAVLDHQLDVLKDEVENSQKRIHHNLMIMRQSEDDSQPDVHDYMKYVGIKEVEAMNVRKMIEDN